MLHRSETFKDKDRIFKTEEEGGALTNTRHASRKRMCRRDVKVKVLLLLPERV